MFIYSEAFLRDHFGDKHNAKYWSPGLLSSICALGLQMSEDDRDRDLGARFYTAAESVCILSGLTQPGIVTVQTILCLSFYALGQGDMSKSWGLSGIAFRMAQDLGFQKDPADWILQDFSITTNEDLEIRRHQSSCPWHDASVTLTDALPDLPHMDVWLPAGLNHDESPSSIKSLIPCFREQIRLSKIIERLLSSLAALRAAPDDLHWEGCASELTLELYKWQEGLPVSARWNKWEPAYVLLIRSIALLHLLFHATLIALNFDKAQPDPSTASQKDAKNACETSAQAITHLYLTGRESSASFWIISR
ncbi:hypothetical protein BJY04DRAFT_223148 [Aspergillus karnatakaensis]|uniref:fungal specific transcription factor domain-containing protein n=1 Tax=Aspergillus karnatakaensis TaxID=1810916 RepID=UPI003CCD3182